MHLGQVLKQNIYIYQSRDSGGGRAEARTTNRTQAAAIRRGKIGLRVENVCAFRVGLHDGKPAKRHAQRCTSEGGVDTWCEPRKEPRSAIEIVRIPLSPGVRTKCHDAESEVQSARLDDDGGIKPVDWWVVGEPGGCERLHGVAEAGVVAEGEREEVRWASLSLGLGLPWVLGSAARFPRCGSVASLWTPSLRF